jgi:hypothetical protein
VTSPIEYVEHPVAFVPTPSTAVVYPSAPATTPPASPVDQTMLAMLGLTITGAGVMKSQTAIAKQNALNAQKAQDLAKLQAQQDAQKADASANWEQNLAMQAEAGQDVVVGVKQSQANKNYWAAFAIWKAQVALVEAKKRAQELAKRQIQALAKKQATLKTITSKNQKSSSTKTKPVEESASRGKLVNESSNRNKPTLKKGIAGLAMLGALFLGGSALISNTPQQSPYGPLTCLSEITVNCVPGPGGGGGNGSGSQSYDHVNQADGTEANSSVITNPDMKPLADFAYGLFNLIDTVKNIAEFPVRVLQSMTFAEIVAEVASMAYAPIDLVYNGLQFADDILTGNVGWHNVFNLIPFASVAFRNFGLLNQVDDIGSGGRLVDDVPTNHLDDTIQYGDDIGEQVDNIPVIPDVRVIGDENFDDLVGDLRSSSVRFSEESIVKITRGNDGKIYWLETGNANAGLEHIITRHQSDFNRVFGINDSESISNLIVSTINNQIPIRVINEARGSAYYYSIPGRTDMELVIAVGSNGFIVSAYPKRT